MDVSTDKMRREQSYEARGVVCKFGIKGFVGSGDFKQPIYEFMSLDKGRGVYQPVKFAGIAPSKDGYLDVERLREGQIVVNPGYLYEPCGWNDGLLAKHLKSLKTYQPKSILERDDVMGPSVDLGVIDHTSDQVTKQ